MAVTAKLRYLRIAPRKVRLVADLIRGKEVEEAQNILNFTVKKSAQPFLKLLNSAVASASQNFQIESDNLYISQVFVDEGPTLKRWRARARGQAFKIQKKTSHIIIVLEEIKKRPQKDKAKKTKRAKKVKEKKEIKKPKFKPELEIEKPKTPQKGLKRIFRRKSF